MRVAARARQAANRLGGMTVGRTWPLRRTCCGGALRGRWTPWAATLCCVPPPPGHAGGLRYHGSAPLVSHLLGSGVIEAEAYHQGEVFESAVKFARCEGTIPAPESAHAVHSVVRHALEAREAGTPTVILFNLSGHGLFALAAYDAYLGGAMDLDA